MACFLNNSQAKLQKEYCTTKLSDFGAGWVHIGNGWNYTSPPSGGWEYGMFLAVASAAVALLGPASFTISSCTTRLNSKKQT